MVRVVTYLKIHERSCGKKPTPYTGCARVALERLRKQQHQETLECVKIGDKPLKNVFGFNYLGSDTQADGGSWQAAKVRVGVAQSVFGKLHELWSSQDLKLVKKLYLYRAGVVSICTHAFETWHLSDKVRRSIRGWSARCLHRISGRSITNEFRHPTWDLL